MKLTGKYWITGYNALKKDYSPVFAHPKCVKAIHSKNTHKKGAK